MSLGEFHLNYGKVPVVPFDATHHPAFFVRDLTGFGLPVQSLSGFAEEQRGKLYAESIINTLFAAYGGSRDAQEASFQLQDPGNGEPEGGELKIIRFEPEADRIVTPEEAAEIGSRAIQVIDGLITVEHEDSSRKAPNPLTTHGRNVTYHALPDEYVVAYAAQQVE